MPQRLSARQLEDILASIGDHLVTYDSQWRYTFINESGARMLGKTVEELIGRCIWEVFPEAVGNQYYRELHDALSRKQVIRSEHYYAPFDRWFENCIYPMPDGVTVFSTDITPRKRTAEQLRLAQAQLERHAEELEARVAERTRELEEKVAELEAFSYSMSHDLRAPVRALGGYAKVLIEDYAPQLDAKATTYLERIARSSERLDRLIRDVLSYVHVGRQTVALSNVDVSALVHDIVAQHAAFQSPGVRLEISPALPRVRAHEPLLVQCLTNLLENAVKFVAPGVVPHIRVESDSSGERVRLCVRDNGIGIPPQHAERIFQMFERVHGDATYAGTGIGLAIVQRAMQRMGSRAGVVSDGANGSTFWLEFEPAH